MRWNLIVWLKSSSGIFHVCFFLISFYFRKPKSQFDETVYNAFQPFSFSVIIWRAIDSWKSIPLMTNAASQAGCTWNRTVLALLIYNLLRFVFYTTRARNIITLLILFQQFICLRSVLNLRFFNRFSVMSFHESLDFLELPNVPRRPLISLRKDTWPYAKRCFGKFLT